MKFHHVAANALLGFLLSSSTTSATTIVVFKLRNVVAVAVDSRLAYSGDKPLESVCKIRKCGDFYVTEAGWIEYPQSGVNFIKLIDEACNRKDSIREKADWLENEALSIAPRLYLETKAANAVGPNLRVIFFGYQNGVSFFAKRGFWTKDDGTPIPDGPLPHAPLDCFEKCGDGDDLKHYFTGYHDVIDEIWASGYTVSDPAEAADELVERQIAGDKSGKVGPPVSVLEVSSKGTIWKNLGLCQETGTSAGASTGSATAPGSLTSVHAQTKCDATAQNAPVE